MGGNAEFRTCDRDLGEWSLALSVPPVRPACFAFLLTREVFPGARQPLELHERAREPPGDAHGAERAADEPLPGLLRGQLDERRPSEEDPGEVGHRVVDHDEDGRQEEPEDAALEEVRDHRGGRDEGAQNDHVRPAEGHEGLAVRPLLERQHEGDEAAYVEAEGHERVVLQQPLDDVREHPVAVQLNDLRAEARKHGSTKHVST